MLCPSGRDAAINFTCERGLVAEIESAYQQRDESAVLFLVYVYSSLQRRVDYRTNGTCDAPRPRVPFFFDVRGRLSWSSHSDEHVSNRADGERGDRFID
jgi:hypothetical protein